MVKWINHVAIAAPRNGSTTHTVDPSSGTVAVGTLFTPTAGNLLVCFSGGSVTSTTPSGWTLPTNGNVVANGGLYIWYKTAAGADTLTTTHNGSNYPCVFDFYEFPAGSTFLSAALGINVSASGGAGPSLSGLTSTSNLRVAAVNQARTSATAGTTTWSNGAEAADTSVGQGGTPSTDGYVYSLTYLEDQTGATYSSAATLTTTSPACERLVVAFNAAAASGSQAATGTIPATTAANGSPTAQLIAAGTIAILTAATGAPAALHPATGVIDTATSATGAPVAVHPATGTVTVTTTAEGAAVVLRPATGTTTVTTTASGAPTALHPATSSTAVTTTATGTADVLPGSGSLAATGTIPVTTATSGAASQRHSATGAVTVTTTASGASTARHPVTGTCAAVSAAAGTPAGRYTVGGIVIVVTIATGTADVFDPSIPPLPTDGVSLTVSVEQRGLTLTGEARNPEVTT